MGDRVYMTLTCRKEHMQTFLDLGFVEHEIDADDSGAELVDEQANYGHQSDLEGIARQGGIPFTAWHGHGGDYDAMLIACDGKTLMEVNSDREGRPIIIVDDDGNINKAELARIRQYQRVKARAIKMIGAPPNG